MAMYILHSPGIIPGVPGVHVGLIEVDDITGERVTPPAHSADGQQSQEKENPTGERVTPPVTGQVATIGSYSTGG